MRAPDLVGGLHLSWATLASSFPPWFGFQTPNVDPHSLLLSIVVTSAAMACDSKGKPANLWRWRWLCSSGASLAAASLE